METKHFTLKNYQVYLGYIVVLILALFFQNRIMGTISLVGFVFIVYYAIHQSDRNNAMVISQMESLSQDFDKLTENAVFNMPFPLVVTDDEGMIQWYNGPFLKLFKEETIMGKDLKTYVSSFVEYDFQTLKTGKLGHIELAEETYELYSSVVEGKDRADGRKLCLFYFINNEEYFELEKMYQEEQAVLALVELDNYNEVMDSTEASSKPLLIAKVDQIVNEYFQSKGALVRKFEDDTYLVVMRYQDFLGFRENRFALLDEVRSINEGNTIDLTLSIGVSRKGLNFLEAYNEADTSLDVALGRGGDQAVVVAEDNYEYFGGKSKAVEKRNKVKARVLGIALRQLIDKSHRVFVMGHTNPDMDAIGAAVGVMSAVRNRGKEGYLVLNKSNPSIDNLMKRMREEEKDLYGKVITGDQAQERMHPNDLLILVDNHKPSFTIHPELLEGARNVVVIDHHRRGKEIVEDPVLTYIEPYASSTSELVTEMITYMYDDTGFTTFEADALMSGIVVDTKNFTFRTGVRTFEAASTLRRAGADMGKVRVLFEDDYNTIISRAGVVHKAKIVYEKIAISRLEEDAENGVLVSAQAADELLDIHGIKASFVLSPKKDVIHISGRSYGEISVQLILEKLGGGGHLNMAGAQLEMTNLDEAEGQLIEAIGEYFTEEGDVE
ncbi:DHH family phosphoesterase [Peptoniphilus sp. KCTC 25270]|uniref:DHH family phosphoesterase n=1 Tax=Peptoniphilus sp. KCTC 25270 TaxID=2897414 RepID=UPI001E2EE849|nr:DHH family phosphoesterase [Peptoniphilus sp. KCTC 25270]MCD1147328.1 DHH family phosphoesterase [Peptoniphilus sp. KCTC 25270]